MDQRKELTLNLHIDWRILMLVIITSGMLLVARSAIGAQTDVTTTINTPQDEPDETRPEPSVVAPANPPESRSEDLRLTINGDWVSPGTIGIPSVSITGSADSLAQGGPGRHVYLTDTNYDPDTALTACAGGYHMASLWEILDVSNLIYDADHPNAYTRADSGHGPPSGWNGRVRTGFGSSASDTAGIGNCQTWTSVSSSDYGTAARLSTDWETSPGEIYTWDVGSYACSLTGPVWCVED